MKSLTAFIIIIVSIALLYLYAWPQWQTVSVLQSRNTELSGALEKAQQLTTIRNNLVTQYSSISPADIEKVSKVVPEKYDPVKLIADINALAAQYGMVITTTSFTDKNNISNPGNGGIEEAPPSSPYKVVELTFATKGQYRNFVTFVSELEKSLQLLDIKNVDIAAGTSKDKVGNVDLDFKINVETYWMN